MLDLSNRVALVTGASSGIGEYFSEIIASHGAKVVIAARRRDRLAALKARILEAGGEVESVELDVTSAQSVEAAFQHTEARFGVVDLLVNNAGIAESTKAVSTSEESWDRVVDTNLKGSWLVAREAGKRLIAAEKVGSVVNVSSILGLRGAVAQGSYAASKAGLLRMTEVLALEWMKHGIRVNALCPGYIKTEMNADFFESEKGRAFVASMPSRRLGNLEELAAPLLLLAGDGGSFINGIALPVDGGHLLGGL